MKPREVKRTMTLQTALGDILMAGVLTAVYDGKRRGKIGDGMEVGGTARAAKMGHRNAKGKVRAALKAPFASPMPLAPLPPASQVPGSPPAPPGRPSPGLPMAAMNRYTITAQLSQGQGCQEPGKIHAPYSSP